MQHPLTRPVTRVLLVSAALGVAFAQPAPAPPPGVPSPTAPRFVQFTAPGGSYLGVGVQDVDSNRARELKLKEERGVEITLVDDDSPAARAGLHKGDVVIEMNGQRVEGLEQFVRMVRETPPGRDAKLTVSRSGEVQTLTVKIAQRKGWTLNAERTLVLPPSYPVTAPRLAMPDMPQARMSWRSGTLGVEAEALKGGLADFFGVKQGVLVRSVTKGSAAEKGGLKAGDVIVRVNDKVVESPADVATILRDRGDRKSVNVVVVREKKELTLPVTLEDEEHGNLQSPPVRSVRNVQYD